MSRYINAKQLKEQLEDFSKCCRDERKQGVDFVLDWVLPILEIAEVHNVRSEAKTESGHMRRIDAMTPKAREAFLKTLEISGVYGESRYECGFLDCSLCPFDDERSSCSKYRTLKEWLAWAAEEIEEDKQ